MRTDSQFYPIWKNVVGKWRIFPEISFTNFRKEYPSMSRDAFSSWFSFNRYWTGGRLVMIGVKHWQITLDFRKNWLADFALE